MRCKNCNQKFEQYEFNNKFCKELNCQTAKGLYLLEKKKANDKKAWRKEKAVMKANLMTIQDWLKITQVTFNNYIRLRDQNENCISCNNKLRKGNIDAGHYYSAGGHYNIRFNELNVHSQCSRPCNKDKSGDLINYRFGLIKRIGEDKVNYLDSIAQQTRKFTIDELKSINEEYKLKIKELKNEI